ncbi:LPS translocon maturation chaperone LptM [Candidatus Nitrosoglobus terrae]|nr:lipoprotein [Candidatus Nitrosoglobus terrae]
MPQHWRGLLGLSLLLIGLCIAGCGQVGPLYLPKEGVAQKAF